MTIKVLRLSSLPLLLVEYALVVEKNQEQAPSVSLAHFGGIIQSRE